MPAQTGAAARDAPRRHRNQAHDALHRHRLTATGFADDGQRFAGRNVEAHAAHRVHRAAIGVELDMQIFHLQ